MIEEQSNDKVLLDLFKIALIPVEAEKVSVGLIKDNILMRKWSPTECDNSEKGETVYQIVYQQYTDERSWNWHMTCQCLAGHLGVHNRVLQHFFGLDSKKTWQSGAKSTTLAN